MPIKSDPATWSDKRHRLGVMGEHAAIRFLESRGWILSEHRFRMGRFEIDLVARKGSLIAFIEVKTRFGDSFGSPLEAVTWSKRREIERVARSWIDRRGQPGETYRLDVIGVTLKRGGRVKIEHIEGAFRAGWR